MKTGLFLIGLLLGSEINAQSFNELFLPMGTYKVGYQSTLYYDQARNPLKDQHPNHQTGRAIHMGVWYPAQVKANAKPFLFEHYVRELASQINPTTDALDATRKSRSEILPALLQIHGDTSVMKSNMDALLKSPTKAFLNASPIKQQFPVVYFPEYQYRNSIMAEALASHGYIVVAPSRHGTISSEFEWQQVRGMETRIQDYQFLLPRINEIFGLKSPSIALMGIGMTASDGLLWMMRNNKVKTLVSMEGGILTQFEYDMMKKSPFYDLQALNKPMLIFYAPHDAVNPELANGFKHADRHLFFMPQLTEFYFLNYGPWESVMPGILGKPPGETKKSYEYVFSYIVNYLDWQLKNNDGAEVEFKKPPQQKGFEAELIQYSFKAKTDIPPSASELETRWQKNGIHEIIQFVTSKVENDPEFLPFATFSSLGTQMINQYRSYEDCIKWCTLFAQQYPMATVAHSMQGRCYRELNKPDSAKASYETALKLIKDDPNLSAEEREGLKNALNQRLSNLSSH